MISYIHPNIVIKQYEKFIRLFFYTTTNISIQPNWESLTKFADE
jgi:hypothetical protein